MASIRPPPNRGVGIRKIRLFCAAAVLKSGWAILQPGASVPSDGVQVVHAAITNCVGGRISELESRLAHRTVTGDEERNGIGGAIFVGYPNLRIGGRTRYACSRLGVAASTAIQVKPGAQPNPVSDIALQKPALTVSEELTFLNR
jgi:hypothetical protein